MCKYAQTKTQLARIGLSKIAYSLEYQTYYIIKEWKDLGNLPPIKEFHHRNNGTEITSFKTGVVDDVGSRSEASLNNRKTALIDKSKQKNQVLLPVKVEI